MCKKSKKPVIGLYFQSLSRKAGGAERLLWWLASELDNNDFHIHVISFDSTISSSFYPYSKSISWHKIRPKSLIFPKFFRFLNMYSTLKINNIDILIGFVMSGDASVFLASILTNTKIIAAERNEPSMYNILYSPIRKYINYFLLYFAHNITVQHKSFVSLYPKFLRRKIRVIPNPVFNLSFSISSNNIVNKRKIILFVGRLDRIQKRPLLLLKSFLIISDILKDWKLYFVGDGDELSTLKAFCSKYQLTDRVFFIPSTIHIYKYYLNSSVFVIPSLWEGFPNALAEAMSYGLPCIGFKESIGVSSLLSSNRGWLVQNSSADDLASSILNCINDETNQKIRSDNSLKYLSRFNVKDILALWSDLLSIL